MKQNPVVDFYGTGFLRFELKKKNQWYRILIRDFHENASVVYVMAVIPSCPRKTHYQGNAMVLWEYIA